MIIRTIIFYIFLSLWTILLGILCLPLLILPKENLLKATKIWIRGIFYLLKLICKITHEIRGLENIPNEPVIVVSKHQSAFETFALYYYLKKSFFIHKKQLFYIPIFGQYLMKSKMVSIDRTGGAKTMRKILNEIQQRINDGSSVIIFPEGTRKKPGDIPNYKTGFIGIYNETKRQILPIGLNSGLYWPKHLLILKKGHITIEINPPIESGLKKDEIYKKVLETIENSTNKLLI